MRWRRNEDKVMITALPALSCVQPHSLPAILPFRRASGADRQSARHIGPRRHAEDDAVQLCRPGQHALRRAGQPFADRRGRFRASLSFNRGRHPDAEGRWAAHNGSADRNRPSSRGTGFSETSPVVTANRLDLGRVLRRHRLPRCPRRMPPLGIRRAICSLRYGGGTLRCVVRRSWRATGISRRETKKSHDTGRLPAPPRCCRAPGRWPRCASSTGSRTRSPPPASTPIPTRSRAFWPNHPQIAEAGP